jgi:hypothetical protein
MGQRFSDRQAKAPGEAWHQQAACTTQQSRQPGVGHRPEFQHMLAQGGAAVQQVEHILVLPAASADNQQAGCPVAMQRDETAP